ncbi:MAG: WYL domain-containing protein [Aristaeellaceae bacterium]
MTLFDAIYGDAFAAMEGLLAQTPVTRGRLRGILSGFMTPDGVMEAEQKLQDGSWPLVRRNGQGEYDSALPPLKERPLTTLEKRWLRSLCEDERAPLFLTDGQLAQLRAAVADVPPILAQGQLDSFDASRTGDAFTDPGYRQRFQLMLRALREEKGLMIRYVTFAGSFRVLHMIPERLEYSAKDRRFRLHGQSGGRHTTLNLARIATVQLEDALETAAPEASALCAEPLVLRILNERNAVARFMLEFSCLRKESTFDPATGTAVAKVWYPVQDENEVLIRVLGFGPQVQVLGPEPFIRRIRERIARQEPL